MSKKYSKPKERCSIPYCRGLRAKGRRICYKHHLRKWRERYPEKAAFHALKSHAKARGIPVTLTYEQFLEVIEGTGYIERSGSRKYDLQLDRIDPSKGYVPGNVRVITTSENSHKSNYERKTQEYYLSKGGRIPVDEEPEYIPPDNDNEPF